MKLYKSTLPNNSFTTVWNN